MFKKWLGEPQKLQVIKEKFMFANSCMMLQVLNWHFANVPKTLVKDIVDEIFVITTMKSQFLLLMQHNHCRTKGRNLNLYCLVYIFLNNFLGFFFLRCLFLNVQLHNSIFLVCELILNFSLFWPSFLFAYSPPNCLLKISNLQKSHKASKMNTHKSSQIP